MVVVVVGEEEAHAARWRGWWGIGGGGVGKAAWWALRQSQGAGYYLSGRQDGDDVEGEGAPAGGR